MAVPPAPVWVPSQRPLVPSVATVSFKVVLELIGLIDFGNFVLVSLMQDFHYLSYSVKFGSGFYNMLYWQLDINSISQ